MAAARHAPAPAEGRQAQREKGGPPQDGVLALQ